MVRKKESKTSIEKALDLIEALKDKDELGVTELSQILGLNKNNVFRLLATLEVKGIIEQVPETGHYKLGIKVLYLEHAYLKGLKFLQTAKPFLRKLRNKINETVAISLLKDDKVIYIYSEESNRAVLVHSRVAKEFDAEKAAPGKVLIKAKQLEEKAFPVEYDFEELEPEVSEISTVLWHENKPIAGISVIAPISRLNKLSAGDFEFELVNCAKEISEKLSQD